MKVTCCECGKRRDVYRPAVRHVDGSIAFVCRQCWKTFDYGVYMHAAMSAEDQQAIKQP